jgi:hypothetical protein
MDIERLIAIFLSVNWSVQKSKLIKLSVGRNCDILLPVKLCLLDPIIIERIVIEAVDGGTNIDDLLNFITDHSHFLALGA